MLIYVKQWQAVTFDARNAEDPPLKLKINHDVPDHDFPNWSGDGQA